MVYFKSPSGKKGFKKFSKKDNRQCRSHDKNRVFYHGTSRENAERILREGFRIGYSEEMYLGKGIYLSRTVNGAELYAGEKGVVLSVTIPDDVEICSVSDILGMGTFYDYKSNMRGRVLWDMINGFIIDKNWRFGNLPVIVKGLSRENWVKDITTRINNGEITEDDINFKELQKYIQIDEKRFKDWVWNEYIKEAEEQGDGDVEESETQVVIHSKDVLPKLKIELLK